eukprot:CAMPEP_0114163842 /NCGR_PEP_ID=MMETSP0043_2-20121206/30312_1 /TAXON_ID=464988 /ORGANISM="Hemiselmis andersenii, Strain CCMP644" /LENGTH=179 /DNA_ID=CAMNT_0001260387 /DNA_START=114 /DNA_END=654 /DNA_ORIENTATION=+
MFGLDELCLSGNKCCCPAGPLPRNRAWNSDIFFSSISLHSSDSLLVDEACASSSPPSVAPALDRDVTAPDDGLHAAALSAKCLGSGAPPLLPLGVALSLPPASLGVTSALPDLEPAFASVGVVLRDCGERRALGERGERAAEWLLFLLPGEALPFAFGRPPDRGLDASSPLLSSQSLRD